MAPGHKAANCLSRVLASQALSLFSWLPEGCFTDCDLSNVSLALDSESFTFRSWSQVYLMLL